MSGATGTTSQGGAPRCLRLRGHEVVAHTASSRGGGYLCFVFLFDPHEGSHELKVFKACARRQDEAESAALDEALSFLDLPQLGAAWAPSGGSTAGCSTISVAGNLVDIFCDTIGQGRFQAFPFVRRQDGTRALIMQFHLTEAVTGETPALAMNRCISRLEEYFAAA